MNHLVLVSGGIDSTTLLHFVKENLYEEEHDKIRAVFFNYGQKHYKKELHNTVEQIKKVGVDAFSYIEFNNCIPKVSSQLLSPELSISSHDSIPEDEREQPKTYVPYRNMILLSMACSLAESFDPGGSHTVYHGANYNDDTGYWDCTTDFFADFNRCIAHNRKTLISVRDVFGNLTKAEIIRLGCQMGVNFRNTWSCYKGLDTPCGECDACILRIRSFKEEGLVDPLVYSGVS